MTTIFEPCEEEAMAILTYNVGATVKKSQKVIIDDWNGFSLTGKEIAELENFPDGKEEQAEHKRASKRIAYRIAKDFKAWSGKNSKMKHRYLGVVLSFAEGDRAKLEADPQLRQQIIQDWLGDMGYDEAQFLAVYHDEANKPHIHIILNLVDMNHKAFDRYRDRYRSQKACRDIEKEYELKVGLGVDESYEVDLKKTGEKNQERVQIGNLAKEAAKTAMSFKEFKELLETKGVLVELKTNNNGTQGLVYRYGDKGIPFAGGEVHSSLTYGKVNKQLKQAAATKKAALEALKEKYPFKDAMHMQYIVHGRHDASIFRSVDDGMDCKYKYEAARKALLSRIMFVAGDQRPEAFYDALYSEQKDGNYRVGSLYIEPNGKISFGEELVFGDPEKTAYSMTKAVTIPAPTATLESVSPAALVATPATAKHVSESTSPAARKTLTSPVKVATPAPSKEKTKSERIAGLIEEANKKGSLQTIINYINETHFGDSAEYHVVPGTMEPIPEGIRLNLSEDGYTSDGFNIYPLQLDIAPIHGKRYIDFTFNDDGHLIAHMELDPNNYYTYGRQGDFNLVTGKRTLSPREYRGTPEEHAQKKAKQPAQPKKKLKKFGKGI